MYTYLIIFFFNLQNILIPIIHLDKIICFKEFTDAIWSDEKNIYKIF